jgi:hypothetical protein
MGGASMGQDCELPDVRLEHKSYPQDDKIVCERIFHTPAGRLKDRTVIAPSGKEYGTNPNPIKTEPMVKSQRICPPCDT